MHVTVVVKIITVQSCAYLRHLTWAATVNSEELCRNLTIKFTTYNCSSVCRLSSQALPTCAPFWTLWQWSGPPKKTTTRVAILSVLGCMLAAARWCRAGTDTGLIEHVHVVTLLHHQHHRRRRHHRVISSANELLCFASVWIFACVVYVCVCVCMCVCVCVSRITQKIMNGCR